MTTLAQTKDWWKNALTFTSETRRRRLELGLALVMTAAATVGLSRVVRPDPSKLASAAITIPNLPPPSERIDRLSLRPETTAPPKVSPEFAAAVADGDLAALDKLYTPSVPLDDMLFVAAESGKLPTVKWLLDHGADVHQGEDTASAPVLGGDDHPDIIAFLLAKGAKMPSLTMAARAGAVNTVEKLLASKANPNPTDGAPLVAAILSQRATAENRQRIVTKLLSAGADPNRSDIESGDLPPLTAAVQTCTSDEQEPRECLPVVRLLVQHKARASGGAISAVIYLDATRSDRQPILDAVLTHVEPGATAVALSEVAFGLDAAAIKKIVAKGVDWGWHDGEDDAALPLVAAVQKHDRDTAKALLDAGAPADRHFKDGRCALGEALAGLNGDGWDSESARLVELLIARGADVNRRLADGRTPLFAAAESGDTRVIHALLDRGARVNELVLDDTALNVAEDRGHIAAARVLHARGGRRAPKVGRYDDR
jgi:uncharacterized protein